MSAKNDPPTSEAKDESKAASSTGKSALASIILPATIAFVAILIWCQSLFSPLLLDEQFLASWLKNCRSLSGSSGMAGFMSWGGFSANDSWGFVTHLFYLASAFLGGAGFLKFIALLAHAANSLALYFCARKISPRNLMFQLVSGLLFAVYPLHYECVGWLAGLGPSLGTLFFLMAFFVYLRGKESRLSWTTAAIISVFALLSVASSLSLWPAFLALALYSLLSAVMPSPEVPSTKKGDLSMEMITCLLPLVVVAAYCVTAGGGIMQLLPSFTGAGLKLELSSLFVPINQINWQKYAAEYRAYYITYGLALIPALLGIIKSPASRVSTLYALLSFLLFFFGSAGHNIANTSFYDERQLYLASTSLTLLLAGLISAPFLSTGIFRIAGSSLGTIAALVFVILFSKQCWNESAANRNCARALASVQKSMRILAEKSPSELLIVRDLPSKMGLVPEYSALGPVAFDPATGLLRSNPVPDGRLKDILRQNLRREDTLRWEPNLKSFLPLILPGFKADWTVLDPEKISFRMQPGISFYKNVRLSADKKELQLESNSENGPMITLYSGDIDPLLQDYIYIDAKVDAPSSFAAPRIELHYQTTVHEDYDKRERFTYVDAIVNDGKVHRYKLSLRANGWTTGGIPKTIAIGFPAGSRVSLTELGLVEKADDIAKLNFAEGLPLADLGSKRYTPPYFNYPFNKDLGMLPLADTASEIKADYSVEHIPDAAGIVTEISWPNKSFDDANSNHFSSVCYKFIPQSGAKGTLSIPVRELPGPGVYSIRVMASAASGAYLGKFSDPLCFQVSKTASGN